MILIRNKIQKQLIRVFIFSGFHCFLPTTYIFDLLNDIIEHTSRCAGNYSRYGKSNYFDIKFVGNPQRVRSY